MSTRITRRAAATLVAAAMLLTAALAAAPQAQAATLYACVKKKSGTVRVFTKKPSCKKGETKVSWNTQGVSGKNGANGANGTNGSNGAAGKDGTAGSPGQPQTASVFNKTLNPPGILESTSTTLATFSAANVTVKLVCSNVLANISTIEVAAPTGSRAETGLVVTDSEKNPPEVVQTAVQDVEVSPSGTAVATLTSNTKAPLTNVAHLNGVITAAGGVVVVDAFLHTGPTPTACIARGSAFSIPL